MQMTTPQILQIEACTEIWYCGYGPLRTVALIVSVLLQPLLPCTLLLISSRCAIRSFATYLALEYCGLSNPQCGTAKVA